MHGMNLSNMITSGYQWDMKTKEHLMDNIYLEQYGYKVFSQNDEDGIIQEIFNRIGTTNKTFVEFGIQDGLECNTHYLLFKEWRGLWIEGDPDYYKQIQNKFRPVIKDNQLKVVNAFITKENINELFLQAGMEGEIDLLSIDIDGNDYYVFEAISVVAPRVVIIEYNAKFPPDCEWVMPYNKFHLWDGTDKHGASLKSLQILGEKKGYQLVGTNINGVNAFFVRKDLTNNLFPTPAKAQNLYNPCRLGIIHQNGHPSKVCLKSNTQGVEGEFEYLDDDVTFISGYGFHTPEYDEHGRFVLQWMSNKKAQLFIKIKKNNAKELQISCINEMESLKVDVIIEGQNRQESTINRNSECKIKIPLHNTYLSGEVIEVILVINSLWCPKEKYNSEDNRKLGIAVKEIYEL